MVAGHRFIGATPWLVASCKSATNEPSGTEPRDVVVDEGEAASEYVVALEWESDR
jgi:hypothetical protein